MPEKPSHPAAHGAGSAPGEAQPTLHDLQVEVQLARKQAEAAQGQHWSFLVTMNQEMRNPMTAIMGMTDLALLMDLSPEQREYLTTVKQSAQSLMRMLNNVLDFARIESGTLDLEWSGFRFRQCVQSAIRRLALEAHLKGLELNCRVAPEIPDLLVADPQRLGEVIEQVVGNSIKFTRQGEVSLDIQLDSQADKDIELRFTVHDTGIGISAEDQKRIFAPFARIHDSATKSYGGTGLGLSIAAALINLMGGHIKVQSRARRGSAFEFTVRLLKQQAASDSAGAEVLKQLQTLAGRRLLIVDSNEQSRTWLAEIASRWGMQVATSKGTDAELAIADEEEDAADMVLLTSAFLQDQNTASNRNGQTVKVLMLTTTEQPPDAVQCRTLGIATSVVKPVFEEELRDALLVAVGQGVPVMDAEHKGQTQSASKGEPRCCDIDAALARLGGDRELYRDVVTRLLSEAPVTREKIAAAAQAGESGEMHRIAHSLKGLASMCGADQMAEAAEQLERIGREQKLEAAPAALEHFDRVLEPTRQELSTYAEP